jgi:hypothetical protein
VAISPRNPAGEEVTRIAPEHRCWKQPAQGLDGALTLPEFRFNVRSDPKGNPI